MRRGLAAIVATLAIGLGSAPLAGAATLHVPQTYSTIQSAIDAASNGDIVLVAPGTYVENLDFLGKAIHVKSTKGPDVTIIDGSGGGASVVTFVNGEPNDAVLEGFKITKGTGSWIDQAFQGGGISCQFASPTIVGNVISENTAWFGAGIACYDSASPIIAYNVIRSNRIGSYCGAGGGIFCNVGSSPWIVGNEITENRSLCRGGGVAVYGMSAPFLEGNVISSNSTDYWDGAGILFQDSEGAIVRGNLISANVPGSSGGGITCWWSSPWIEDNDIVGNVAFGYAGIVSTEPSSSPIIRNNRICGNVAFGMGGGGISCLEGSCPLIVNNLITENVAQSPTPLQGGSALFCQTNASPTLINNTITRNWTQYGPTILLWSQSNPLIVNTILWGNEDGNDLIGAHSAFPVIRHSIVEGGWDGEGENNLDEDPRFVDAAGGDYHLRIQSPCVDAGDDNVESLPLTDFEGDPRIANGDGNPLAMVDIGADELLPEIAARFGTVNAAGANLANVLLVNGSVGDHRRTVEVPYLSLVSVAMTPPPGVPGKARFALYLWSGEPDLYTLVVQPHHLGVMTFATPLQPDLPQPLRIWNNLGHWAKLGTPNYPSSPAPSTLFTKAARWQATFTLQGFIQDGGSAADGPVSVTNAVVVKIVE